MKNIVKLTLLLVFSTIGSIHLNAQCDPCQPLAENIIPNGDFENPTGNTIQTDLTNNCNCLDDSYCLEDNADDLNCAPTYPSIQSSDLSNNYMVIKAFGNVGTLWTQTGLIDVQPNTEYYFSFHVYPELLPNTPSPPLDITINGVPFFPPNPLVGGQWQQVCIPWFSGNNNTADITIDLINGAPNTMYHLGLDNVSLRRVLPEPISCQLMVELDPSLTTTDISNLHANYPGLIVEDVCPCGPLELWSFGTFPITTGDGKILFDIENIKRDSRDKAEAQGSDYNYYTDNPGPANSNLSLPGLPAATAGTETCAMTVAIIDTGVDKCHPHLNEDMWSTCSPCSPGATEGYNYAYNDLNFFDDSFNGHGTHVAGTVKSYYKAYNDDATKALNIMPVKAMDSLGSATLFQVVCATSYAIENGADVINMSLGYRGDSTEILYRIIEHARLSNEIVVVTSAGNDFMDNDISGHYPSNHSNENIIAVAADSAGHELYPFSSWGAMNVDLSAEGKAESSVPYGVDVNDGIPDGFTQMTGTSMAAAKVSAAAALAKQYIPLAKDVKSIIVSTAAPLVVTTHPTASNKSLDFVGLQSTLDTYNPCSSCCGPLSTCSNICSPCEISCDFCYETNGKTIDFSNTTSGSGILSYEWDFGDGTLSTDIDPIHTYSSNSSDTYIVCLTTTNTLPDGTTCCRTTCKEIAINVPCYDNIPGPVFNFNSLSNGAVKLNNPSGAGNAFIKTWTIDGEFYSDLNQPPVVTGLSPGLHEVCLEITKNSNPNCNERYCRMVYVNDPCIVPTTAKFKILGCLNSNFIAFEDASSGTNGNTVYEWDFGDGTIGSGPNVSHFYPDNGTYTVSLTLINGDCSKRVSHTVVIDHSSCDDNCTTGARFGSSEMDFTPAKDLSTTLALQVLPNPVKNEFKAIFDEIEQEKSELVISDAQGKVIQTIPLEKGIRELDISARNLIPGMYILSLDGPEQEIISIKFIKE